MIQKIVALHGAGMNASVWQPLSDIVGFPFHALSFPGHDLRHGGAPLRDVMAMADWVMRQLADAPEKSVLLLGHSMGGLAALAASGAPAVGRVAVLGTAERMPVNPALMDMARREPARAQAMVIDWAVYSDHPHRQDICDSLAYAMRQVPPDCLATDFLACDSHKLPAACARPLDVIVGRKDKMVRPTDAAALADHVPGAAFHQVADAGHMLMQEAPAEISRLLRSCL